MALTGEIVDSVMIILCRHRTEPLLYRTAIHDGTERLP